MTNRYIQGGNTETNSVGIGWWDRTLTGDSLKIKQVVTISPEEHMRPDLIAAKYYNDKNKGWFVLQTNNIVDLTEIYSGKQITIYEQPQ
jgi:hypothetical protein